jgi:hypothetical protein
MIGRRHRHVNGTGVLFCAGQVVWCPRWKLGVMAGNEAVNMMTFSESAPCYGASEELGTRSWRGLLYPCLTQNSRKGSQQLKELRYHKIFQW